MKTYGEPKTRLHPILTLVLSGGGQLHTPAILTVREQTMKPNGYESGAWQHKRPPTSDGNQTQVTQPMPSHFNVSGHNKYHVT